MRTQIDDTLEDVEQAVENLLAAEDTKDFKSMLRTYTHSEMLPVDLPQSKKIGALIANAAMSIIAATELRKASDE